MPPFHYTQSMIQSALPQVCSRLRIFSTSPQYLIYTNYHMKLGILPGGGGGPGPCMRPPPAGFER